MGLKERLYRVLSGRGREKECEPEKRFEYEFVPAQDRPNVVNVEVYSVRDGERELINSVPTMVVTGSYEPLGAKYDLAGMSEGKFRELAESQ
ncbi:hypothetical protein CMI46_02790 [Candidatus Pacearchaeota archaeon]|jgi:hypothetical protein|nr:hypothetical protein [Candidatus Pacearchaeota archaeon]|tara:strand:- start:176 stop:451 length:276 start_codon:yes stop_codon:yes gene_type:complete